MYIGTFRNVRTVPFQGYNLLEIENEFGDNWYKFRDSKTRMKYIIATDQDDFVVYSGESGHIGFNIPLKIYNLNEVPDDHKQVNYCFNGVRFEPYFSFEAWKYDELSKIRNAIEDAEDDGKDTSELKKYRKLVKNCTHKANMPDSPFDK